MNKIEYENLIAFHPGYYIEEMIEDLEIGQDEFAKRLGISKKILNKLVEGEINLTDDVAIKIASMFGSSKETWINLQKEYDSKKMQIEELKELDEELQLLKLIDYNFFTKLGFVERTKDKREKLKNLYSFLKISKLSNLLTQDILVNYRVGIGEMKEKNILNSKVWLQTAINMGRNIETKPFNKYKLETYIPKIRELTVQESNVFIPKLKNIFIECGVSFVTLPHLKNSGINGAVTWINKDKVILAINDRRNYADTFWFSLFHEIKHVLQQKHQLTLISSNNSKNLEIEQLNKELEEEADLFSQEILISHNEYYNFIIQDDFTECSICEFAKKIDIHPGIVVGRLQKEKYIEHSQLNFLKDKI